MVCRRGDFECLLVLFHIFLDFVSSAENISTETVSRVAFASCAHQDAAQPVWMAVMDFKPQVYVWLGDNVYADGKFPTTYFGRNRTAGPWKNSPQFYPVSIEEMEKKYAKGKTVPGYQLLRQQTQVIGTWDDHDYGLDNSGKELPFKKESQKLMLDYLDEPEDSSRRRQEGIYASYTYGPSGKQIKIILLDTRYHRDSLFSNGNVLGEDQWKWLEDQLTFSKSQINIIASSIQVISNFSALVQPFFHVEAWSHYPAERERLFNLISHSNASGVFFLSGDVHFGEISRDDCAVSFPLYDITSSGLTQAVEKSAFGIFAKIAAWLMPTTMRVYNPQCHYSSCVYGKQNFGIIQIEWHKDPVVIHLEVRDVWGNPMLQEVISLSDLQATKNGRTVDRLKEFRRHCTLEVDLPWYLKYRLALSFYAVVVGMFLLPPLLLCRVIKKKGKGSTKPKHE